MYFNALLPELDVESSYPGDCVMSVGTDDKTALKIRGIKLSPPTTTLSQVGAYGPRKTTLYHLM